MYINFSIFQNDCQVTKILQQWENCFCFNWIIFIRSLWKIKQRKEDELVSSAKNNYYARAGYGAAQYKLIKNEYKPHQIYALAKEGSSFIHKWGLTFILNNAFPISREGPCRARTEWLFRNTIGVAWPANARRMFPQSIWRVWDSSRSIKSKINKYN